MIRIVDLRVLQTLKNTSPYLRTICIYRYVSLLLISVFYLMDKKNYMSTHGLLVAGCLAVAALALNYMYKRFENFSRNIKLLIIVEIVSNIIILIPTGGLESPYIWYSLNTVLIASYFLNTLYFALNLFAYTGFLAVTSFYISQDAQKDIVNFFYSNSNLILSYFLIIFTIQLLMNLTKKLDEKGTELSHVNKELVEANSMIEESMGYIASLFQSLQGVVTIRDKSISSTIIAEYTKTITKTDIAFLYTYQEQSAGILEIKEDAPAGVRELLPDRLLQLRNSILSADEPLRFMLNNREYVVSAIKSSREVYGAIGIGLQSKCSGLIEKENISQVKFLASLVSIVFENFRIEEINQLFLISDEQKRIANEIHDSVSQRLFYVSCKIHSLLKTGSKMSTAEMNHELELVRGCLNTAMAELRDTIYNYGRKDSEVGTFEEGIKSYINEIAELNNINISLDITGNQEFISLEQKKSIYRIICEGIGNSIRHGNGKNIGVDLRMEKERIILRLSDDGAGFDMDRKRAGNSTGLGIRNLNNLVSSCYGDISIKSQLCKGTVIDVVMPNMQIMKAGQEDTLCV